MMLTTDSLTGARVRRLLHRLLRHLVNRLAPTLVAGVLIALALRPAMAQTKRWSPIGPDRGTVLVAAHMPSNDSVMLAGTYFGGLYRSSDWGYTWAPIDAGFSSTAVFSIGFDARTPGRVYAGMYQLGVWRSDDAGLTWAASNTGLTDGTVQAVAVDPTTPQRVLAATPSGLFTSGDAGASWAAVASLVNVSTRLIAHDPLHPGTVYVGSVGLGVYRSADGGATWASVGNVAALVTTSALGFDSAGNLYAATNQGVFQLPAGANAWVDLTFNLPAGEPVLHLLVHPTVPNVVIAATRLGTYVISNWAVTPKWFLWAVEGSRFIASDRQGLLFHIAGQIGSLNVTSNFGASFSRADYGIQTAFIGGMATGALGNGWRLFAGTELGVAAKDFSQPWVTTLPLKEGVFDVQVRGNTVYAGTEASGVNKSIDGGLTWSSASTGIVPARVAALTTTVGSAPTLLAATGSSAYRSTDAGNSWSPVRLPEISFVHTVAADPVRPPIVWLSTGGGRVYRSLDSGVNFTFAGSGLPAEDILKLVHAPWSGVYAVTGSGKLYSTTDNGVSWFPSASTCAVPVSALQVDPGRPWFLYAATQGGGICKSESGGLSWVSVNTGMTQTNLLSLVLDPRNPQQLWAGGIGRVFHTTNGGLAWDEQSAGLPAGPVTALSVDPADGTHLWAVIYGAGLYETRNGGASWALASATEFAKNTLALLPDPAQAGRLLAGTVSNGVQVSVNSGQTWTDGNRGMSLFVRSIAPDPGDAATLYAGTISGAVFRTRDAATTWAPIGVSAGNVFRVRSPAANRVLVGTDNGISESVDAGVTWANVGQAASYVQSLVTDPADPRRAMVGSVGGTMWLSDTAGGRWYSVGAGLPALDMLDMATCSDGTVYAAPERAGVWKSSFASPGAWVNPGSAGLDTAQIVTLACDPRSGLLYAGTNDQGVWLSLDRAAGWAPVSVGLPAASIISAVVPSATTAWQVWAAVLDGSVYRSDDAGLHWAAAGAGLPVGGVSHLVTGPDGVLFAGTANGVYRRPSATANWVRASVGLGSGALTALWADPARAGTVMAAVTARGLYRSLDAGASWLPASTDASGAAVASLAGQGTGANARIYAGTAGTGVASSSDAGASFGAVQVAQDTPQVVLDIATPAADPQTLFLASGGQGLLVSRDGGAHWKVTNNGLGSLQVLCIAAHPTRAGEAYAGSHSSVYLTRDYGTTWTALNTGLVNKNATALLFDTVFPETLYVGIEGGGIWYYDTRS